MRRRLRQVARQLLAAAGTVTLAGMVLAATSPAQAATAGRGSTAGVSSGAAAAAKAKPAGGNPAKAKPAWAPSAPVTPTTADTRAACVKVKAGYSTCMSIRRTNVPHYKGLLPAATASRVGYGPAQLQSAYNLPSATLGSGETVAVVDAYDNPHAEADLQLYRAQYHLSVCNTANGCFAKVNQDGLASPLPPAAGTAGPNSAGWGLEVALDIDMVSAICPNCRILLVVANSNSNNDLYAAEDTAVAMGAKFVSNSWAGPEYPGETADNAHFNHPGVVIAAATGDFGYGTLYPAASRYVTAVGGTDLVPDSKVTRGWQEYAWGGAGSGCSFYEPKPAWQTDTGCQNRTESDVSAVADPHAGVAVYDSYDGAGWGELGGTSVATPVIAATYALAGLPAAGTYPSSYPYAHPSGLNDITVGINSPFPCGQPSTYYLCKAGPGYDGPTGLGTPDGVRAFSGGVSSGTISGKVSGKSGPLAGATVTAGAYKATTGSSGSYVLTVPAGTYTVSAEAFGYQTSTAGRVPVTANQATTQNFTLSAVPNHYTVSGTVSDGSGHHWPVYASIGVRGYRDVAAYTNPYTGHYSISLPEQGTYTLTVTPVYPGYRTATTSVSVGTANVTHNFGVNADASTGTCSAPGYAVHDTGSTESFTGWPATTPQDGWTVVNNSGDGVGWRFDNRHQLPPPPGGDASFASIYPPNDGYSQDASLVSPVVDLSQVASPVIAFDTLYFGGYDESANVDLSLDGGKTWSTVWQQTVFGVYDFISVPIPQAAGNPNVRVRFHFLQTLNNMNYIEGPWEVDNVVIGTVACSPTPGGLAAGVVTDHNSGTPVNDATVTNDLDTSQYGTSSATPADPGLPGGGYYWLFAPPGSNLLTASDNNNYTSSTQTVNVAADALTRQNWSLQAGGLAAIPGSLSVSQTLGSNGTVHVKFLDTGTQPVQVQLSGQSSGFTPAGVKAGSQAAVRGAPLEEIPGHYTAASILQRHAQAKGSTIRVRTASGVTSGVRLHQATPSGTAWAPIANYPTTITGNAAGYDPGSGHLYSAAGNDGTYYTNNAYVFNPLQQQWSAIAPLPEPLVLPGGAFAGGKFYVLGGVAGTGNPTSHVYAYQPSSDSWSQIASLPTAVYAPATAVLNNVLYVIGGCTAVEFAQCGGPGTAAVYRYNPSSNRWTALAPYPVNVGFEACAGIKGKIVCAGGLNGHTGYSFSTTYIYHPASNTWSRGAAMPYDNWGMAYAGSGNMLQIVGGVTGQNSEITNQAAEYDPSGNTWRALPNAPQAVYAAGGGCGLYQVGGDAGSSFSPFADVLPGYDACGTGPIPWLSMSSSSFTLQPGQVQTVTVTTNSTVVGQPGTYTAELTVKTDTPYQIKPVSITMTVNPPSTWSEVKGTVTDASTGKPLPGATVQICANYNTSTGTCGPQTYTVTTGSSGNYQLWLNRAYNPLQVIAAALAYQPALKVVKLVQGAPVTANFALSKIPSRR